MVLANSAHLRDEIQYKIQNKLNVAIFACITVN